MAKRTEQQLKQLASDIKNKKLDELTKNKFSKGVKEYSPYEASAWPILREEALEYQRSGTIGEYMALEIGLKYNASTLAAKIIGEAEALKQFRAAMIRRRQEHSLTIKDMLEDENVSALDIQNYDISTGWPI